MSPIIRHGYATVRKRNGSTWAYRKARMQTLNGQTLCHICWQPFTEKDPPVADHIIPHAYGGSISITNLRPAHASCNKKRGAG